MPKTVAFALGPTLPLRKGPSSILITPLAQLRPNPPSPSPSVSRNPSSPPPPPPPPQNTGPPPPPPPPPRGTARDANYAPNHISITVPDTPAPTAPTPAGTVYFAVPSRAAHLPPLEHWRDGDGFVLAVSFDADGAVWPRARFVRTKPFMRETREKRRVYRGRYGTPGSSGLTAPVKPKPTCADGVTEWGKGRRRRVVAFGDAGLPLALDMASLVSRKPTALGSCLTDAPELAGLRGAELSAPPVVIAGGDGGDGQRFSEGGGMSLALCTRTRNTTGRITGVILSEIDEDVNQVFASNRLPLPALSHVAAFAVTETHYLVFYNRVKGGGGANPLGTIFGGVGSGSDGDTSPELDAEFGTKIMFCARGQADGGSRIATASIPGVFVTSCVAAQAASIGSGATLDLVCFDAAGEIATLGALADAKVARSGCGGPPGVRSASLRRFEVDLPGTEVASVSGSVVDLASNQSHLSFHAPAEAVTHPARFPWQKERRVVSAVVDTSAGTCGVAALDTASGAVEMWTAGETRTGLVVSAPVPVADGRHVAALVSGNADEDSRVVLLDVENMTTGPVCSVALGETKLGPCVGGLWSDRVFTWGEHGGKASKSAYEMFEDKEWNNINSSFSSFGFNQD